MSTYPADEVVRVITGCADIISETESAVNDPVQIARYTLTQQITAGNRCTPGNAAAD